MVDGLQSWAIRALNLPEHARNPIHTDEGAQAAGFPSALVAGVTTYAYLTHPLAVGWGEPWLEHGGAEVRFRSPVFAGDLLETVPVRDESDAIVIEGRVGDDARPRAMARAWTEAAAIRPLRDGEVLATRRVLLDGELGSAYGERAGDDLALYAERGLVHPAVWPALANNVVHADVARGSWIHVRSHIQHHGPVRAGAWAEVRSVVVERFRRSGERAVLDVHVVVDDVVVAVLEHEAIVALP